MDFEFHFKLIRMLLGYGLTISLFAAVMVGLAIVSCELHLEYKRLRKWL